MTVDVSQPSSTTPLGKSVNRKNTRGQDKAIVCKVIDAYEVPSGCDPQEFKERLIAEFCGASTEVRDDFIEGLSRWLSEATQE